MKGDSGQVVYEFAGFCVDTVRRRLLCGGAPISVTSKAFDTLLLLIERRGTTVTKSELMNSVWPDAVVEENNLTQQISTLRRVLGERPNDHRFIVTVPGRGYCFVAEVELGTVTKIEETSTQRRFARLDAAALRGYGVAISYVLLIVTAFVWSAVQHADGRQTLAVLNFRAADRGDEFIGIGISETLRARLGSVEDLIVRPAAADADVIAAGHRLHVDTVVTGSIQRDGGRIRVVVEMVDVVDGRVVWGQTFDETASDVFALQDTIAGEVAFALTTLRTARSATDLLAPRAAILFAS
jgi:DNA-binding winged helix-turn-helix (wHTH) protein/TolB-like protein